MQSLLWDTLQKVLGKNFLQSKSLQKNIQDLSYQFTENRASLKYDYLAKKDIREAYVSYYVPLNFNKCLTLLKAHASLSNPYQNILDFGCGPGTATLAYLQWLSTFSKQKKLEPINIWLIDHEASALKIAVTLVEEFAKALGIPVNIKAYPDLKTFDYQFDYIFAANVLNELKEAATLEKLLNHCKGDFLILEPSHRVSSQKLIRFRDRILKDKHSPHLEIVGPCTHKGACPIYRTKHWCHFSEPLEDKDLIYMNQKVFRNPRLWLKFSYLYLRYSKETVTETWDEKTYRAIGDLHPSGPGYSAIDLCMPKEKYVLKMKSRKIGPSEYKKLLRGSRITLIGNEIEKIHLFNKYIKKEVKP